MMELAPKPNLCLRPGCGKRSSTRGLCVACYSSAYELVKNGRTTWEKLEAAGKCVRKHRNLTSGPARWLLEESE